MTSWEQFQESETTYGMYYKLTKKVTYEYTCSCKGFAIHGNCKHIEKWREEE